MEEEDSMVTTCGWAYTLLHRLYRTRVSAEAATLDMARFSWVTQGWWGPVPLT